MTESHPQAALAARVAGRWGGEAPGPVFVVVCGIHGNEPAGPAAAERVLSELQRRSVRMKGELIAIRGNLTALAEKARYVVKDLNRQWTVDRARAVLEADNPDGLAAEDREQWEMWQHLGPALARAEERGRPAVLFDLHTSSANGPPFATMGDTLRNRTVVFQLPIPVILGLEEVIDGALLEYVNNRGHITVGIEAGRHDAPASVDHHEALLWLGLIAAGCLTELDVPRAAEFRRLLAGASAGIPRIVEIRHRHAIRPEDSFSMKPGFTNFDTIHRGEVLGEDREGPVRAPMNGLVLLPLYQGLGDDGFFMGGEVRRLWLSLSAILRRLSRPFFAELLPGVQRSAHDPESLVVDTRVARFYPLELFHLFGYRKRRRIGHALVVSRRRERLNLMGRSRGRAIAGGPASP